MRRAPIVVTATVAGLIAVLEFHSHPARISVGTPAGQGTPAAAGQGTSAAAGQGTSAASGPAATSPGRSPAASPSPRPAGTGSSSPPGGTRTAVGPAVDYSWGVLSVSVTASGRTIVKVGIGSLDDGGNPRSQMIDQQAIPILEQETLQAQSANIQGVSGASYTSAGFAQSLQAALHQLGLQ